MTFRKVVSVLTVFLALSGKILAIQDKFNVLMVGIDGCRPDALLVADTPNIDKLWHNGAYSFHVKSDTISYSGPCWTSILTGVWHQKHNVISNNYSKPNIEQYPHIFSLLKKSNKNRECISVVRWAPINKIMLPESGLKFNYKKDQRVSNESISILRVMLNIDIMFIHLGEVDSIGHKSGFSVKKNSNYIKQIQKTDILIGEILSALELRQKARNENWVIILTTDHGGVAFDHGQNIDAHTNTFFIVSGKNIKKGEINTQVNAVDIGVTVLDLLGVSIEKSWNLDGKVIDLKKSKDPVKKIKNRF